MADITWKVSDIKYCGGSGPDGWIINPTLGQTGTDETTLTISIKQSSGGSSDCSAATITISASTGDIQYIPVTRCLRECSCKSIVINAVSVHEIANSGENNILLGNYDNNCSCSNLINATGVGIITNVRCSNGEIRGNVGQNCDDSRKSGTCNVYVDGNLCKTLNTVWQKADVYTWTSASTRNETYKVTASTTASTEVGCNGGTFEANGTKLFNIITKYECKDSCGRRHSDKDYENVTGSGTASLGTKSVTFSSYDCCEGGHRETKKIKFEDGGYSAEIEFKQNCPDCSSECGGECYYSIKGYSIDGPTELECEGTQQFTIKNDIYEAPGCENDIVTFKETKNET